MEKTLEFFTKCTIHDEHKSVAEITHAHNHFTAIIQSTTPLDNHANGYASQHI